jgi:hypothetical protein
MIHVVVVKCLIGLPSLMRIELLYEGVGVGVLKIEESEVSKIEESESELLCTDSTALRPSALLIKISS